MKIDTQHLRVTKPMRQPSPMRRFGLRANRGTNARLQSFRMPKRPTGGTLPVNCGHPTRL